MKKTSLNLILLLLVISMIFAHCSSSYRAGGSSKKCGCGVNRGYVGY